MGLRAGCEQRRRARVDHERVHPAGLEEAVLMTACDLRRTRRGGPGGQRRNKVQTAVVLMHTATSLRAEASERRSARENQAAALFRLRLLLALELRTDREEVSELWRSRVRAGRVAVNPMHADFPAMLAEALDTLAACGWDTSAAAERLTVSHSQLVKFLRLEPRAMEMVNAQRADRGAHRLY